jgi:ring-1,2-phenylacetyl-CoA epoxidase subunit PaaD
VTARRVTAGQVTAGQVSAGQESAGQVTAGQVTAGRVPARQVAASVVDPEIRVVTIEELGILRDVTEDAATGKVIVTITPTYAGCPAMEVIRTDIRRALLQAGYPDVEVATVLRPAWSTDMINSAGRDKLVGAGIAPPGSTVGLRLTVRCPRCGSPDTAEISRFGSTACKALWRCRNCEEPFDHVKAL